MPGKTQIKLDAPPANLLLRCDSLPLLPEEKPLLLGDDAVDDAAISLLYYDCALRQRRLIDWVERATRKENK